MGLADLARRGEEVRTDAGVELGLSLVSPVEEVEASAPEPPLEIGDERERLPGQDPLRARDRAPSNLDAGRTTRQRQPSPRRTVASMRPCGSVVAT